MTLSDFKNNFNLLFNNLMSNGAPDINDYELSLLLTKAEREVVKNHLRRGNKYQEGINDSIIRDLEFAGLIQNIATPETISPNPITPIGSLSDGELPFPATWSFSIGEIETFNIEFNKILFVLSESILLYDKSQEPGDKYYYGRRVVKPISYREYERLQQKPYKYPNKNSAWRLSLSYAYDEDEGWGGEINILANPKDANYSIIYGIQYVINPPPIIIADGLPDIEGYGQYKKDCVLPETLHEEIVQRAVEIAKATYSSDQSGQAQMQNQITIGQRSE